jgi:hypothetical protein
MAAMLFAAPALWNKLAIRTFAGMLKQEKP